MHRNLEVPQNPLRTLLPVYLIVTVLALAGIAYFTHRGLLHLQETAREDMNAQKTTSVQESQKALRRLGEETIRLQAESVASQVEVYLAAHPNLAIAELQKDQRFKAIAVQPVGETGYTALTDRDSLICRFHNHEGLWRGKDRKFLAALVSVPAVEAKPLMEMAPWISC